MRASAECPTRTVSEKSVGGGRPTRDVLNHPPAGFVLLRVVGGTRLRVIFIVGHNMAIPLYSFFEFLPNVGGRLLRDTARCKTEGDQQYQTARANISHPRQTKESDIFLQFPKEFD